MPILAAALAKPSADALIQRGTNALRTSRDCAKTARTLTENGDARRRHGDNDGAEREYRKALMWEAEARWWAELADDAQEQLEAMNG